LYILTLCHDLEVGKVFIIIFIIVTIIMWGRPPVLVRSERQGTRDVGGWWLTLDKTCDPHGIHAGRRTLAQPMAGWQA